MLIADRPQLVKLLNKRVILTTDNNVHCGELAAVLKPVVEDDEYSLGGGFYYVQLDDQWFVSSEIVSVRKLEEKA